MALIEGGQLSVVPRLFNVGVDPSPGVANIDLKNVSQVLNVVPEIRRRSAPLAGIDGIFTGILRNVHSIADDEISSILPYSLGADRLGSYPAVVPEEWDIWLIGASGRRVSGTGSIVGTIVLEPPDAVQGFARDDSGTALGVLTSRIILGTITGITELGVDDPTIWLNEPGGSFLRLGIRVPRGSLLLFRSTSSAIATIDMVFVMGLFPMSMGHDVVQL